MKYFYLDNRTKRENVIAEMRRNLRAVHNKYCTKQDMETADVAIDVFAYGRSENGVAFKNMEPFIEIALFVEGMEESYEESDDKEFFEAVEKMVNKLKEEMERV